MCSILFLHAPSAECFLAEPRVLLMFFHLLQQCPWKKTEWKLFFQKLNIGFKVPSKNTDIIRETLLSSAGITMEQREHNHIPRVPLSPTS